jgi:hypothetical protein
MMNQYGLARMRGDELAREARQARRARRARRVRSPRGPVRRGLALAGTLRRPAASAWRAAVRVAVGPGRATSGWPLASGGKAATVNGGRAAGRTR